MDEKNKAQAADREVEDSNRAAAEGVGEEYSNPVARLIASASGIIAMAILCCGDMAVSFFKWANHFLRNKLLHTKGVSDVSPKFTQAIHWVKMIAKMVEGVSMAIPSGIVMVIGYVGSVIVTSKPANKLINLLPGEIVHATLDAFHKIGNASEVARKNVVFTLSGATTQLVSDRYGDNAARATDEGLEAAGHTLGAASAVSNIPTAMNPNNAISRASLAQPHKKRT